MSALLVVRNIARRVGGPGFIRRPRKPQQHITEFDRSAQSKSFSVATPAAFFRPVAAQQVHEPQLAVLPVQHAVRGGDEFAPEPQGTRLFAADHGQAAIRSIRRPPLFIDQHIDHRNR